MTLLDITDDIMEDTLVQSVGKGPPTAIAMMPKAGQRSSDFSGDTLVASDAREFLDIIQTQKNNTYDLDSDDKQGQVMDNNMFWPSTGDFESDERQRRVMDDNTIWPMSNIREYSMEGFKNSSKISNTEDPLYLPLHTPCVGNYMARGELNTEKRPHRLFPLVRPSLSSQMASEGHRRALLPALVVDPEASGSRSRSTSGGTVEIHRLSSPNSSSNVGHSESKRRLSTVEYLVHPYDKNGKLTGQPLTPYRHFQILEVQYTE